MRSFLGHLWDDMAVFLQEHLHWKHVESMASTSNDKGFLIFFTQTNPT